MENNKKEYNIFESVEFLNEGIGSIIFGIYFGFIAAIGAASIIGDAATKAKIRKTLKRIENDNKSIKDLKSNKLKKIVLISDSTLIEDAKISGKAKVELEGQGKYAVCCGAYDYNDKLIAYSIFDKNAGHYGINFVNKSLDKDQQIYIGACFELKFGKFGKNVDDLIGKRGLFSPSRGWIDKSDKKEFDKYKPAGISQEEFDKIYKAMTELSNKIANHLRAKFKIAEVHIQDDIDESIYITTFNENYMNTTDVSWAESNHQKYFEEVETILKKEKFEFHGSRDRYATSSNPKWKYIRISSNWGDDYDGFEICISCTKDINKE